MERIKYSQTAQKLKFKKIPNGGIKTGSNTVANTLIQ